ncbi:MAG: 3-hydroxybutyryl-CoA dehydrogenase [Bacteroidetes bacterium]|nr:3-hydroxybutyryl-CoA dehydrogenase [Bacteroidota bacterium]
MKIEKVVIAGSGVMGSGIAQVCAMAGFKTILYDIKEELLISAEKIIQQNLSKAVELGKLTQQKESETLNQLSYTTNFETLKADLILEAIPEKLELKQAFFRKIAAQNSTETILATNTSSIPITQIANGLAHPERVIGIHFFNPAHIMKLVEIIQGESTSAETTDICINFVNMLGKRSVMAKDAPGFIVNRVARHYYLESLKIAEEGVADFQTIDKLLEATGFKMGAFRLMDLIGVETNYSVTESMFGLFNYENRFRPNRIQKQKVIAGFHGRKTKRGFYVY